MTLFTHVSERRGDGFEIYDRGQIALGPEDFLVGRNRSGDASREGKNLGAVRLGEAGDFQPQRHGVTTQRRQFLAQVTGLGARGDQAGAQVTVAGLEDLEQSDVLQSFAVQLLCVGTGIQGPLRLECNALHPKRPPGQRAAGNTAGDGDNDADSGVPDITDGQRGRSQGAGNQGEP